ncbi:MAG: hypothetical protein NE327_14930 [Lentisphaeraceae bacterium]|nr:hypothetical protein [Lentisphaeraceae bacterium]
MLPKTFDWWYENVSDFLTENEAKDLSKETLDEICIFLDNKEYKAKNIIYLRGKCRTLSFPVLFHKFDKLLQLRLQKNHLDEWSLINDISERTCSLKENFDQYKAS